MKKEKLSTQEADDIISQMREKINKTPRMRDHVIHFRRICDNLVTGKTRTATQIAQEMGIAQPTLQKLLTAEIDETFHIRASILGLIQDFSKKYTDYERINVNDDEAQEWKPRLDKFKGQDITLQLDPGIQPGIRQEPGEDPFTQLKNAVERIYTELGAKSMTLKITIKK